MIRLRLRLGLSKFNRTVLYRLQSVSPSRRLAIDIGLSRRARIWIKKNSQSEPCTCTGCTTTHSNVPQGVGQHGQHADEDDDPEEVVVRHGLLGRAAPPEVLLPEPLLLRLGHGVALEHAVLRVRVGVQSLFLRRVAADHLVVILAVLADDLVAICAGCEGRWPGWPPGRDGDDLTARRENLTEGFFSGSRFLEDRVRETGVLYTYQ